MSPRNFARLFRGDTGETPARFTERVQAEAARRTLEQPTYRSRLSQRNVASFASNACGAPFSAFSISVRTTIERGFDQLCSTDMET